MAGRNVTGIIETVYEYAGSQYYNSADFLDHLAYNINTAQDIDSYVTDISAIADKTVEIAKGFILENGTYQDGTLYRNVKWRKINNGFQLYDDARDKRGRPYAGHIEYGFTDRAGMPHGPWPFLRPAMRIAAEMSTGVIGDRAASNILYGVGSGNTLQFGRRSLFGSGRYVRGMNNLRDEVRTSFGSRNKVNIWEGRGRGNKGLQDQYRWREAKHGINHMGKIDSDIKDSFVSSWGNTMSRDEFRRGEL